MFGQVGENEAVAFDGDPRVDRQAMAEHRPGVREGVEFAALAARIDRGRQLGQKRRVELAPGKLPVETGVTIERDGYVFTDLTLSPSVSESSITR